MSSYIDLAEYPIIYTFLILFMIVALAVATAYTFKIKSLFVILLLYSFYSLLFYAFGILPIDWLSGGLIVCAIVCFILFGRSAVKNGE